MKIRKSVGAFVVDKKGRFLLVKKNNYWDIVKGGIEKNESEIEALKRELKEELGTDKFRNIKKLNMSFSFEFPEKIKKKIGFDAQKVELFLVEFYGDESEIKVDGKEISDFVFLDREEFLKKATYDDTKRAFLKIKFPYT